MDSHDLHIKVGESLIDRIAADPGIINRPAATGELTAPAEQLAAAGAATEVVLLHPDEHLPAPVPAKGHKLMLLLLTAGVFLVMGGGGAAAYFMLRPAARVIPALATPSPIATPSSSVSPSVSPTPSSVLGVTAPAAAPAAEHPQIVTVTNPSGLWLRSSPSSASKVNIIGWMPKGAQVNVDQASGFWWHGTYNGKTGYFAVSYTK